MRTDFGPSPAAIPSFMQQAALELANEIENLPAQNRLLSPFLTQKVFLGVGLVLLFLAITLFWLIEREKRRLAHFRDQIRVRDLKLIQQILEKFYQDFGYYPSSQQSREFTQVLDRAKKAKVVLRPETQPNSLFRLAKKINLALYQKVVGPEVKDARVIKDPCEGQKLPGSTERSFSYHYSARAQDQTQNQSGAATLGSTSYLLWCYLETTSGNRSRGGFNVLELTAQAASVLPKS